VPGAEVNDLALSADGRTIYWLRSTAVDRSDATTIVALDTQTNTVRDIAFPHPLLAFRPFGDGVAVVEVDPAQPQSCGQSECQQLIAEVASRSLGIRVVARADPSPSGQGVAVLASYDSGILLQLLQNRRAVTLMLSSGTSDAQPVRVDSRPAVGETVVAGQVVGQYYGALGLWTSPVDNAPGVPLIAAMRRGAAPVGNGTRLAWELAESTTRSQLVVSTILGRRWGQSRVVPTSDDTYNVVWRDQCHLVDREADGLYDVDACVAGHIVKERLMTEPQTESVRNQARFDARAGRCLFALTSADDKSLELVLLDPLRAK